MKFWIKFTWNGVLLYTCTSILRNRKCYFLVTNVIHVFFTCVLKVMCLWCMSDTDIPRPYKRVSCTVLVSILWTDTPCYPGSTKESVSSLSMTDSILTRWNSWKTVSNGCDTVISLIVISISGKGEHGASCLCNTSDLLHHTHGTLYSPRRAFNCFPVVVSFVFSVMFSIWLWDFLTWILSCSSPGLAGFQTMRYI